MFSFTPQVPSDWFTPFKIISKCLPNSATSPNFTFFQILDHCGMCSHLALTFIGLRKWWSVNKSPFWSLSLQWWQESIAKNQCGRAHTHTQMNNVLKIQKKVHFRDAELFASKAKVNIGNLFEWSNLEGTCGMKK